MKRDNAEPEEILSFWIDQTGPVGWYSRNDDLDSKIRDRWAALWDDVRKQGWPGWTPTARSVLAYVILTDQFPRNMFRNDARAFATDDRARAAAKSAIERNWDLQIDGDARQFFYLPLIHSECLVDQERAVRLFKLRMPGARDNLVHARAHREVIRKFGRFPHRNADLGRKTTGSETDFLSSGGYGSVVDSLKTSA
ncbi:MAG: DUF924 domain-containing protein [Rhodobacteraceae bacterium]|nr:DUF924 domain-containing protein [Paracoccaceae bacterium]